MKSFPMFLRMDGRRVVICGGGTEAARKARLILRTEAEIVVVAAALEAELAGLVASGRARHLPEATGATFENTALAFIATGDLAEDTRLAALARAAGAVVNVVDRPELCEAYTPAIVDRDPVVVAIGTEGTAPVLGRAIRARIETLLDPGLGAFAALAGRFRDAVAAAVPHRLRRGFWEWVFTGAPMAAHRAGDPAGAARLMTQAIGQGRAPAPAGRIALVGAGPGARDLMTLRAVQRLHEADVILSPARLDPGLLDLARRDADREVLAADPDRAAAQIRAAAAPGRCVVVLAPGDGRAASAALRAAGIAFETVPGVAPQDGGHESPPAAARRDLPAAISLHA